MSGLSPKYWWGFDGGSGVASAGGVSAAGGVGVSSGLGGGVTFTVTDESTAVISTGEISRPLALSAYFWLRQTAGSSLGQVVSMPGWSFTVSADGTTGRVAVRNEYGTGTAEWIFPLAVGDGRWHQFVVTSNESLSGHASVWVDGQRVGVGDVRNGYFGQRFTTGPAGVSGVGSIDELAVFARELITAEVHALWRAGNGAPMGCAVPFVSGYGKTIADSAPVGYWPLNSTIAGGGPTSDYSGSCMDGITGSVAGPVSNGVADAAVGTVTGGPVFHVNDTGVGSVTTYARWMRLPSKHQKHAQSAKS